MSFCQKEALQDTVSMHHHSHLTYSSRLTEQPYKQASYAENHQLIAKLAVPAGTTPDPTLGQGGGAVYAASFNVLNFTSSTFSGNIASRVNITDFKAGRGAGGAISINSDALITSSCSAGLVSITGQ